MGQFSKHTNDNDNEIPSYAYWILAWLMIHCWYFIIEVDVKTKVLLFLVVIVSSASNQFIHWVSWESLTVAHRTYVISNLLLCLYSFGLMERLVAM